jgi:hypothetical protein
MTLRSKYKRRKKLIKTTSIQKQTAKIQFNLYHDEKSNLGVGDRNNITSIRDHIRSQTDQLRATINDTITGYNISISETAG